MTNPANPFGGGPAKGGTATATKTSKPAAAKPAAAAADPAEDAPPQTLSKKGPRKDPFARGGGGDSDYQFKDFLGELLLLRPHTIGEMVTTASNGKEQPYVVADVYRLENADDTGQPEFVEDVWVFQKVCNTKLRKVLDGPNNWMIGRLEMGIAKGGKNAPYLLNDATDDEVDKAYQWATAKGLAL